MDSCSWNTNLKQPFDTVLTLSLTQGYTVTLLCFVNKIIRPTVYKAFTMNARHVSVTVEHKCYGNTLYVYTTVPENLDTSRR